MATQLLPAGAVPFSTTRIPNPEASLGPLEQFGFYSLVFYLFLIISRAPELIAVRFGSSYSQILISTSMCAVFLIISGSLFRVLGNKLTIALMALHFWYALSVPFSSWRTGSLEAINTVARIVPLFLFIAALIRTEKQLLGAFMTMRIAMLVALVYTMTAAVAEAEDRLMSEGSRFSNSNEIAMYLLIGLPFWLHMAISSRFNVFVRVLASVEIALSLFQCLRTGSRGGLITILILGSVVLLLASPINKLKLLVLGAAISLVAFPLLPPSIRERLLTLSGNAAVSSAGGSSESRRGLLFESIRVTFRHPVLGVGLGVYAAAAADISASVGEAKRWQVGHNAYTQVSSECGIPALLLFLWTLVVAARMTFRTRRMARSFPGGDELSLMAGCILLSGLVYIISGCFANIAQELFFYMLCGFALACEYVTQQRYGYFLAVQAEQARNVASVAKPTLTVPGRPAPIVASGGSVIGRPPARTLESQYGDVPWAKNP